MAMPATALTPDVRRALPTDGMCDLVSSLAWRHRTAAPRRAPVHHLVLLSAQKWPSSGFRIEPGRLGSWVNTTRLFHMTHIAKTGGRSVREELLRFARPVGGAEQCYPPFMHESRVNVIFFREPRGHALSQYLHGAYQGRFRTRRAAGYPVVKGDDAAGFAQWVSHFARGWTPARGDFYGYNPLNHMSRALMCTDERWNCDYLKECTTPCAHHVGQRAEDARPPLAEAIAAVHAADFVGVLELLPEALCLVEYRKLGRLNPACICGSAAAEGAAARAVAHRGRGVSLAGTARRKLKASAGAKISTADVAPAVLRELDEELLSVDMRVYRAAVLRTLCDLRALERASGTTLLCDARMRKLRNKTGYVAGLWDGAGAAVLADEWASARLGYPSAST